MKLATVERLARALNDARVPYLVVGGLAVAAHGYVRTTQDIDLVIRLSPGAIRAAFDALATLGYRPTVPVTTDSFSDPAQRARWIADKGMRVLSFASDQHPLTPVDVFVSEPFDFQAEHDAAFVQEIVPGVPLRFVRLTTLIRLKEEAARPRDLADLDELRKIQEELPSA